MLNRQLDLIAEKTLAEHGIFEPIQCGGLLVLTSGNVGDLAERFKAFQARYGTHDDTNPGFAGYKILIYLLLLHKEYFIAIPDSDEELFEVAATFAGDNIHPYNLEVALRSGALRLQTAEAIAWAKTPGAVEQFMKLWWKRVKGETVSRRLEPVKHVHDIRRHFTHGDLGIRYTHAAPVCKQALHCLKSDTVAAAWLRECSGNSTTTHQ